MVLDPIFGEDALEPEPEVSASLSNALRLAVPPSAGFRETALRAASQSWIVARLRRASDSLRSLVAPAPEFVLKLAADAGVPLAQVVESTGMPPDLRPDAQFAAAWARLGRALDLSFGETSWRYRLAVAEDSGLAPFPSRIAARADSPPNPLSADHWEDLLAEAIASDAELRERVREGESAIRAIYAPSSVTEEPGT
jgi:hypothetical protein